MQNEVITKLCALSELPPGSTRGFTLGSFPHAFELFLVNDAGRVLGYRNQCPHTGVGLEWLPGQFLDHSGAYIQCHTHGALFRIDDGYCVSGPCSGQWLQALQLRCEADVIYLVTDTPIGA